MSSDKIFFNPKLEGKRFEDHTIPVNILEDFVAFEELVFELAKKIYLENNTDRKRVPNGFGDNIYLKLSKIDEGSSMPVVLIASALNVINPQVTTNANIVYYEQARDRIYDIVENANNGNAIDIDSKYINYFNRIGRNLEDDESIDFLNNGSNSTRNVKLNKNTRREILLSRTGKYEYSEKIKENVLIPSIDKKGRTFRIELDENIVECHMTSEFSETINTAFNDYEANSHVCIKGIGVFNKANKLVRIERVESMDILDPFDVNVRLKELRKLKDNWYENREGKSLDKDQLDLFESYFESFFKAQLQLPAIFPTLKGDIVLEWKKDNIEITTEVNLTSLQAQTFYFDMQHDESDYQILIDLNNSDGWEALNNLILNNIS